MKGIYVDRIAARAFPIVLLFVAQIALGGAPSVIPRPKNVEPGEGAFRLSPRTKIVTDEETTAVGRYLRELLASATGLPLPVERVDDRQTARRDSICLRIEPSRKGLGDEGYSLVVGTDAITVCAPTEAGVFHGIQTLRQLLPAAVEKRGMPDEKTLWEIPCCTIDDSPRFAWRGMMIDCSRTFWSIERLERLIRLMALYKLNRLHLHLTDDQGWRLEIKKYPRLTEVGSKFAARFNEPAEFQGFYSQAEMKALIEYARRHHVTIVPEIDMPGHSLALLTCYPELSNTGGPFEIPPHHAKAEVYPKIHDSCCAGNERTFEFFEEVLSEVAELFPCEFIHIGGDEVNKSRWRECAMCQDRIKEEGLKNEDELQSYFIKRIEKIINSKGKRMIGWDEILEGGLAPNATVMSWRGTRGGIKAAKAGHDVVMTPRAQCYFNYRNSDTMTLYDYDPVPKELSSEQANRILGAQACLWTQTYRTEAATDPQVFPRFLSLAEITWAARESRDQDAYRRRVREHLERLDNSGVAWFRDASLVNDVDSPAACATKVQ